MRLYPLFLVVAATTVLSPGPGVVMTITNSLRHGFRETLGGIAGLAVGALAIAGISATGLGVLLATSAVAFAVIRTIGALYLVYLGVKLWQAPPWHLEAAPPAPASFGRRFGEGLSLQLTNPKAIAFFVAIFPQFIDRSLGGGPQFTLLVLTYSTLVVLIHCGYALTAQRARPWLTSERSARALNRVGGATFVLFGAALATTRR